MSATDPHDTPHDTPPGLLAGLGDAVLRAVEHFDEHASLGAPDAAKPAVLAELAARHRGPVLILTPTPATAADLADALPLWLRTEHRERLRAFPVRETAPYERHVPAPDIVEARLATIEALRCGSPIIVADIDAAAQRTLSTVSAAIAIRQGSELRLDGLMRTLDAHGYARHRIVVEPAMFAVRGGILDFWPPAEEMPVRVELFGDEVESIRRFDPFTQRSTDSVEQISLRPAREWSLGEESRPLVEQLLESAERGAGEDCSTQDEEPNVESAVLALDLEHLRSGSSTSRPDFWTQFLAPGTIFDHLSNEALILIDEPHDIVARAQDRDERAEHAKAELERGGRIPRGLPHPWLTEAEIAKRLSDPAGTVRTISRLAGGEQRLPFRPAERLAGKLAQLFESLRENAHSGARVLVSLQAARLSELMADLGLPLATLEAEAPPQPNAISVGRAAIAEGWRLDDPVSGERLATLISDTEIFGFERQRQRRPLKTRTAPSADPHLLETLKPGDFVVHVDSGIGRFQGVVHERIGGREGEYLDIRFAKGDRLLVPTDKLDRVQPYVGPSGRAALADPPRRRRVAAREGQGARRRRGDR